MVKESSGNGLKTPRGSLKSLTGLLPVFATVVMTFMSSDPSPSRTVKSTSGVVEGAAETATTEATRAMREARREKENIVMKVMKGAEEATLTKPWDQTSLD